MFVKFLKLIFCLNSAIWSWVSWSVSCLSTFCAITARKSAKVTFPFPSGSAMLTISWNLASAPAEHNYTTDTTQHMWFVQENFSRKHHLWSAKQGLLDQAFVGCTYFIDYWLYKIVILKADFCPLFFVCKCLNHHCAWQSWCFCLYFWFCRVLSKGPHNCDKTQNKLSRIPILFL